MKLLSIVAGGPATLLPPPVASCPPEPPTLAGSESRLACLGPNLAAGMDR